ncbi:MlaD family protein [Mucilaginibacter ginkgonis]|uniref:MCE family protein n=1 Tax=Mucilaginibacter ginkgonis TaxID=2682091 RepID=A0A6I4INZ0_9SPHI|nr:MCE family protein [Mucilaginibacter ginkgonis]QQL48296.1 MCE family protein [Mucilaginibacter ginkgonis]
MNNADNKKAIWVGVFIAIGIAIFIVGVLTFGNERKTFSNGLHISAVFNDVNGLTKGNNVWFSGVKVGTIKDIKFTGVSQVYVTMNIDKNAQQYIRRNAGVRVSAEGFIGNKLIVIEGGSPSAPVIEDGDRLNAVPTMSTDDITKTLQKNNLNLLAITSDFKALTRKIIEGKGMVGQLMTDSTVAMRFRNMVTKLDETSNSTASMAHQLQAYGVKLNSKDGLANKLVTDTATFKKFEAAVEQLRQTTKAANTFTQNLNKASEKLNSTDNVLGVLLNDKKSATQVQSSINNLQEGSVKLNDDLEAAQHNFFLKGFFKKRAKQQEEQKKLQQQNSATPAGTPQQ